MQEVVKRMQERQAPKIKPDKYYELLLVNSNSKNYLVVMPSCSVSVGDIVWFPVNGKVEMGEVVFDGYYRPDQDMWDGLKIAMNMEPILATKYAMAREAKWEDES